MKSTLHFISGLPRSGSTLLSAILGQNPRFVSGVSGPMATLVDAIYPKMSGPGDFTLFFDDPRRKRILTGLFESFYADAGDEKVIFDTNRAWTAKAALLANLYPDSRIVCCVRSVGWIINSIEKMLVKNPLHYSSIFNVQPPLRSIYSRVDHLMNPETGLIGQAWSTLRESWFGENAHRLIVIQYESLVRDPARVMNALYQHLREPHFVHDFDNLMFSKPELDASLGMPGLHEIRRKVESIEPALSIPPEIFTKFVDCNFWLKSQANPRGVLIL